MPVMNVPLNRNEEEKREGCRDSEINCGGKNQKDIVEERHQKYIYIFHYANLFQIP